MRRRTTNPSPLKIRVSHEVTRLEKQCMADAFERLLSIVERRADLNPIETPSGGLSAKSVASLTPTRGTSSRPPDTRHIRLNANCCKIRYGGPI